MNWFDIVVAVPLVWAVWRGFHQGFVQQLFSIAALLGGVWVAWHWGEVVGILLGIGEQWALLGGFALLFALVLLVVALIVRLTRGLFSVVGLGSFDTLLGVLFSMLKVWFVACLALHWTASLIGKQRCDEALKESSLLYGPMCTTADWVFPYIDSAREQIAEGKSPEVQNVVDPNQE